MSKINMDECFSGPLINVGRMRDLMIKEKKELDPSYDYQAAIERLRDNCVWNARLKEDPGCESSSVFILPCVGTCKKENFDENYMIVFVKEIS